jgi:hypothetical protein
MPAHHIDSDPLGLIGAFLQSRPTQRGDAERVFVAWLVSLDPSIDPAAAAAALLSGPLPMEPAAAPLVDLLRDTTRWPRAAVAAFAAASPSLLEDRR